MMMIIIFFQQNYNRAYEKALLELVWFFRIAHLLARALLYWLSKNHTNSGKAYEKCAAQIRKNSMLFQPQPIPYFSSINYGIAAKTIACHISIFARCKISLLVTLLSKHVSKQAFEGL